MKPSKAAVSEHDRGPHATTAVVALVGRPNVGKSALFNRMVGHRQAIVEDLAGTTRDRLYGEVTWRDDRFSLVDTGGLDTSGGSYPDLIRAQIQVAVEEASVLLFVVDAKDGVVAADEDVADILRRSGKPVFLLANKVDNESRRESMVQFYELALGEPIAVSAQHGIGISDVLDRVIASLPPAPDQETDIETTRIAIIGRPNVGKSMLLNAVLGEERVIVSSEPGTTRDAIDSEFEFKGRRLVLVDTAGLRRAGKMEVGLEHHAAMRARHALDRADVALCLFDASEGLTAQDGHIIGFALKAKTGVIAVANKWDLLDAVDPRDFEREEVRRKLRFAPWVSFRVTSAKERAGIAPVLEEALRIHVERQKRIETGRLNSILQRAIAANPPSIGRRKQLKLLYVTQPEIMPPTFVFFVNDASLVHFSYRRYLENTIRSNFGFEGVALKLAFRSRKER
ncbi:MAG: ribosome biogenesis GTPase Der [Dehalococcoidia bacterium]